MIDLNQVAKWVVYIFISTIAVILLYFFIYFKTTTNLLDDPVLKLLLEKHRLDGLFANKSGYFLLERKIGKYDTGYGEITCVGMESICDVLKYNKIDIAETIFFDFGCGVGKAIVMAKLLGFKKAIGVEIVKERYDCAMGVLDRLPSDIQQDIEVYNADMLKFALQPILDKNNNNNKPVAIFASNLLWSPKVTKDFLAKYMRETPEGSMIVSSLFFIHPGDEKFILSKNEYNVPMSWSKHDMCTFTLLR